MMLERILDLLFPPKCTFCHELLQKDEKRVGICSHCMDLLEQNHEGGKLNGEFFDKGLYCFEYEGNIRKSLHRFKFGGRKEYAGIYARYLLKIAEEDKDFHDGDIITYVPTNRKNIRKRGYNHSALIAKEVSERMGIPLCECLKKTRDTSAMFGLKPHERRANISGAIALDCAKEQIEGKRVIIIDDIFTTGATAGECSWVLKTAGAQKVFVLTVAKTEKSY
ncbi:MAG: ComF family protein [Clostridiaceae bacterium]|nr:ComF family protein [Clostridiaceae bacterium]